MDNSQPSPSPSVSSEPPAHTIGTDFYITDVLLASTGESVQYATAPAKITPKFHEDHPIQLTIKGLFKAPEVGLTLDHMLFTLSPGILHQTTLPLSPPAIKVLLNDSLLLTPLAIQDTANETTLTVQLNTQYLPDTYLQGMHHLSVSVGQKLASTLIKVGAPDLSAAIPNLQPVVDTVTVIRGNNTLDLKLVGKNFFIQPKFTYAQIDGEFGFGQATVIYQDGKYETLINVPNPAAFSLRTQHSLSYITPYGIALKDFVE